MYLSIDSLVGKSSKHKLVKALVSPMLFQLITLLNSVASGHNQVRT